MISVPADAHHDASTVAHHGALNTIQDTAPVFAGTSDIRIVVERGEHRLLATAKVSSEDTVEQAEEKFRCSINEVARFYNIIWNYETGYATMELGSAQDTSNGPRKLPEVMTADYQPISKALRERPTLNHAGLENKRFLEFYNLDPESNGVRKCVLLKAKPKKRNIWIGACAAILMGIIISILVGVFTHNVGYGLAAMASSVGVIAFLVTLLTWVIRREE